MILAGLVLSACETMVTELPFDSEDPRAIFVRTDPNYNASHVLVPVDLENETMGEPITLQGTGIGVEPGIGIIGSAIPEGASAGFLGDPSISFRARFFEPGIYAIQRSEIFWVNITSGAPSFGLICYSHFAPVFEVKPGEILLHETSTLEGRRWVTHALDFNQYQRTLDTYRDAVSELAGYAPSNVNVVPDAFVRFTNQRVDEEGNELNCVPESFEVIDDPRLTRTMQGAQVD